MRLGWRFDRRRLKRWHQGRISNAELLGLRPCEREELLWHAHQALVTRRTAEAENLYRLVLAVWNDSFPALLGLGAIQLVLGNLDEAERIFRQILSASPSDVFARTNLAECLLLKSQFDLAGEELEVAQRILELRKDQPDLRRRMTAIQDRLALVCGAKSKSSRP